MTDSSPWMTKAELLAQSPFGVTSETVLDQMMDSGLLAARTNQQQVGTSIDPADLNPTTRYCWGLFS